MIRKFAAFLRFSFCNMKKFLFTSSALFTIILPCLALASPQSGNFVNQTSSIYAILALIVFCLAYLLVMFEDATGMSKSKPVVLAAGFIWMMIAILGKLSGNSELVERNINQGLLEYGELLLFLLVAITYINVLEERLVFEALKNKLLRLGFGFQGVYWLSGILAFLISPIADNFTTALVLSAVVLSVGRNNTRFICLSCINIVVAANAGGAFSPFGDITTLMVWQNKVVPFGDFFSLFIPALVNFLLPALIMSFALPKLHERKRPIEKRQMKPGAIVVIILFLATIITAVCFQNFLELPAALGMITGLGYLMFLSFWFKKKNGCAHPVYFDVFKKIQAQEWDTLLFFFGILLAVKGLATLGYLELVSRTLYQSTPSILPSLFNPITQANILIGIFSAVVDNIPVMFGVLSMHPPLNEGQWLLITLTTGVGGSLLSIGSAAGIAVMGKASGHYTFRGHLKWSWVILLGYFASIAVHLCINRCFF